VVHMPKDMDQIFGLSVNITVRLIFGIDIFITSTFTIPLMICLYVLSVSHSSNFIQEMTPPTSQVTFIACLEL
jgi:hypothetical protein